MRVLIGLLAGLSVFLAPASASAETVSVAVAANFTEVAEAIGAAFTEATGHNIELSPGSTGQLYTLITQSAPYQVFLAADNERPQRAVAEGFGVKGTVFTYGIGQLVLFSTDPTLVAGPETLTQGVFEKLAIADPEVAPYGAAAVQTLTALGVADTLAPKLVRGESITQTYQFVDTRNAELGFVALSQVVKREDGSRWIVPNDLYTPIRQDAVLLKAGESSAAAREFITFLKGEKAQAIIAGYGYALAD